MSNSQKAIITQADIDLLKTVFATKEEVRDIVKDETRKIIRDETQKIVEKHTRKVVREETQQIVEEQTRKIVKEETAHFATKSDLTEVVRVMKDYVDVTITEAFEKHERRFGPNQEKLITMMQDFLGELRDSRQEIDVLSHHSRRQNDTIESVETDIADHEDRISALESRLQVAEA